MGDIQRTLYISDGDYAGAALTSVDTPLMAVYVYKDDAAAFNNFSVLMNYVNAQPTLQPLLNKVTTTNIA